MRVVIIYLIIFILIFLLFTLLIIPSIWCYDPSILTNLKYDTNLNLKELDKPYLFICNHEQEINLVNDQILACTEAIKTKLKMNIVSWDKEADNLSRFMKKLPLFPKYNLLYTGNNLVERCKEKLKTEHVWMFLKKEWKNKGAYHIIEDKNIPIIFVKIIKDDNIEKENSILSKTFNRKYKIEYEKVEDYKLDKDPEIFMKFVKEKLYN